MSARTPQAIAATLRQRARDARDSAQRLDRAGDARFAAAERGKARGYDEAAVLVEQIAEVTA